MTNEKRNAENSTKLSVRARTRFRIPAGISRRSRKTSAMYSRNPCVSVGTLLQIDGPRVPELIIQLANKTDGLPHKFLLPALLRRQFVPDER